ncbi:hypothetical protein DUNSADRAFT_6635 [Dunaliella salina]|uniref:diphosphoinositol-pentakisphosphate 1-kinase n=1 Tax=Dunaliella salina TaxID=3046 RepID=A0ABQ7GMZ6_DUNSA|nr:hypothetical protein DUNSADRAFT_6635 [Dunaliella salina]|eukprot:KAF5835970.1 hypothetical protein DUNSADRAFT_6635 [Dunaliella salina]
MKQEGNMGSHKGSVSSFMQRLGGAAGEEEGGAAAPSTLGSGSTPTAVDAEGETEEREPETLHRLCPTFASDINSPLRHVRTRIYFTSESHIHSLVNVLRFCHLQAEHPTPPLVSESSQQALDATPEMDYLTHIVFRMYENKSFPVSSPQRFRVEVSLSPGAAYNPITHPPAANHTLPTVPRMQLNSGTAETLSELEELLSPLGVRRKVSPSIYALHVALRAPTTPARESGTQQVAQPIH